MGTHNGQRIRQSLNTVNWKLAEDKKAEFEAGEPPEAVTVREAVEKFIADCKARDLGSAQLGKYELLGKELKARFGDRELPIVNVDDLRAFRESWKGSPITKAKKLERLRTFFRFCHDSGWIARNPSKALKPPKLKPIPTLPIPDDDVEKILWALELYPDHPRGRREQVKAFVLLLRYSGLRIGDAISLTTDKLRDGKLRLYTGKTVTPVYIPLPENVSEILKRVANISGRFFWSGNGILKSAVADWQRTLARLFKLAGVKAHAHQFRHTFAVNLLQSGVSLETVSILLGHSSLKITEKHYAPWVKSRQAALETEIEKAWKLS
jgi:integrase/recombinase XerD